MTVNNHAVIFSKKISKTCGLSDHSSCGFACSWQQRWDIPSLELHGYIDPTESMPSIRNGIEREVAYDLGEREKRELGIGCRCRCYKA